jgi:hypothetical protein
MGTKVEFRVSGGVIVPKVPSADDESTSTQRRVIDRDLAEGLADMKHGRVQGPFASHKEFVTSLHREAGRLFQIPHRAC